MEKFIKRPSIELYPGITVDKDTVIEYENENVSQSLANLLFKSITKLEGEDYESEYKTVINLKEGDILIFEEEGRGYIKPVEQLVSVREALEELVCIKDI